MKNKIVMAWLAASALSMPHLAYAQESEEDAGGIRDIVVTAQKRSQSLQDVPIAISALSSDYLQQRQVTSISSLSGLAPNLKVDTAGANQTTSIIAIRGGVQGNPQIYEVVPVFWTGC